MIRRVQADDAAQLAAIYNAYVLRSTATFETEPVSVEEMRRRVEAIGKEHPYLVYEEDGCVAGYCYAHPWKERAAYRHTWETTVYLSPAHTGRGIGTQLMERLMDECRQRGCHALVACITAENAASRRMHERLGFRQVSCFEQVGRKFGRWLGVTDYEWLAER